MEYQIEITEEDLPVISAVAGKALNLMQSSDASNSQIEELIKQDPALTQRVLHVANSPFYGGRVESRTIMTAISRLGLRQLRNVIMMAATGELFEAEDVHAQALWEHSVASAIAAQILADELRLPSTEEAFIAAMLHDVGKLIIYRQVTADYTPILDRAREGGERVLAAENALFVYFNHSTVGGLTIRKWRLADSIAESVRFHHDVETAMPKLGNPHLASIVSLASVYANNLGHGRPFCTWQEMAAMPASQHLKLTADRAQVLAEKVQHALEAQWPTLA